MRICYPLTRLACTHVSSTSCRSAPPAYFNAFRHPTRQIEAEASQSMALEASAAINAGASPLPPSSAQPAYTSYTPWQDYPTGAATPSGASVTSGSTYHPGEIAARLVANGAAAVAHIDAALAQMPPDSPGQLAGTGQSIYEHKAPRSHSPAFSGASSVPSSPGGNRRGHPKAGVVFSAASSHAAYPAAHPAGPLVALRRSLDVALFDCGRARDESVSTQQETMDVLGRTIWPNQVRDLPITPWRDLITHPPLPWPSPHAPSSMAFSSRFRCVPDLLACELYRRCAPSSRVRSIDGAVVGACSALSHRPTLKSHRTAEGCV